MLQYQPKLYQICPSAYGVNATSIRTGWGGGNRKVPNYTLLGVEIDFSPRKTYLFKDMHSLYSVCSL